MPIRSRVEPGNLGSTSMMVLLLSLSLLATPEDAGVSASAPTAREENSIGMGFYREGKLPEAAAHFARATELEPKLAIAHYNLAAVLVLTRDPCDLPERSYLTELAESIRLDPRRRARLAVDPDFAPVRRLVEVQRLLFPRLTPPESLAQLVVNCTWTQPDLHDSSPLYKVVFQPRGTASYFDRGVGDDRAWHPARPGRWWVTEDTHQRVILHVRFAAPGPPIDFSGSLDDRTLIGEDGQQWLYNNIDDGYCG